MTPFCRVDSRTYFIRGMARFLKLYFFFVIIFRKIKKYFFFTYCH
ncbi:unnamed protein product, partial [Staurois parvus]